MFKFCLFGILFQHSIAGMATIYILQDRDDESSGDNRPGISGVGLGIGKNDSNLPSLTTNQPAISVVQSVTTTVKPHKSRTSVSRSDEVFTDLRRGQSTGTKPPFSVARPETTSKADGSFHSKELVFSQYLVTFMLLKYTNSFGILLSNQNRKFFVRCLTTSYAWETRFWRTLPTSAMLTNFWFLVAFSANCHQGGNKNIETHLYSGLVYKYHVEILRTNIYWNTGQSAKKIKIEKDQEPLKIVDFQRKSLFFSP